jgi:hypothetical protein
MELYSFMTCFFSLESISFLSIKLHNINTILLTDWESRTKKECLNFNKLDLVKLREAF